MAADVSISIKDEASARAWLNDVMLTNEEYHEAMREAGETLQSAKDFGEGTMVDEFYDLGTNVLNTAKTVFDAINEISNTVNTVLNKVAEVSGVVGEAVKVAKSIFGGI